jgi:undecaprenyl-diphosphatase
MLIDLIHRILSFDQLAERYFDLHRTPFLTTFFLWITSLGDARIVFILVISAAIVLLRHHHSAYVFGLLTAVGGSFTFTYFLKLIVTRGRPLPSLAAIDASGYSFPSLHAACSMSIYGFLIFIIWKLLHPPHHRIPLMSSIAILVVLIGLSRLYLGVHYPSDVIVGYVIGGGFVWLASYITVKLERQTENSVWRMKTSSSKFR